MLLKQNSYIEQNYTAKIVKLNRINTTQKNNPKQLTELTFPKTNQLKVEQNTPKTKQLNKT